MSTSQIKPALTPPPRGLAMLALVGPSLVWCAEYIGSGEVILATRNGALFGTAMLWAVVVAISLKCCIGMAGAQWTAITGEGMIDMLDRMPGPRHWLVWIVTLVQLPAAVVSIGALAKVAGVFINSLLPLAGGQFIWGLAALAFAVGVAWTGRFDLLKGVMSFLVMLIIVGVFYAAIRTLPPVGEIARGFLGLQPVSIPGWAAAISPGLAVHNEVLPLMGWAAGGFASQVWYTYWVLGAGYGAAAGRGWGKAADPATIAAIDLPRARELRGWCRVVRLDASVAATVGILVTTGFALAGAGVLRPAELLPKGNEVALTLSRIFTSHWGALGGILFLVAGSAAMVSTLIGQLSGWPRLLSDCVRILYPPFARREPKKQLRLFLAFFVLTNLATIFLFDGVKLVQLAARLDGLILTPVQAVAIIVAFLYILPRMMSRESYRAVRPSPVLYILLAIASLVFGTVCVFML